MLLETASLALLAMLDQATQLRDHIYSSISFLTHGISQHVSLGGVVLFIAATTLVWFLISSAWQYSRLRHFDGPPLAKISNLWLFASVDSGRSHLDFWEVTQKYGQ
jgi:hypothetical protein